MSCHIIVRLDNVAPPLMREADRLKTRVMKVLDRMGYKPKVKEEATTAEAPRLTYLRVLYG